MARNIDTEKNASFVKPASAPVDIKYRSERATMSLMETLKFINAIDPSTLPEGVHAEVLDRIGALGESLGKIESGRPSTKTEAKAGRGSPPKKEATPAPVEVIEVDPEVEDPEEVMRRMGEAIRDEAVAEG